MVSVLGAPESHRWVRNSSQQKSILERMDGGGSGDNGDENREGQKAEYAIDVKIICKNAEIYGLKSGEMR